MSSKLQAKEGYRLKDWTMEPKSQNISRDHLSNSLSTGHFVEEYCTFENQMPNKESVDLFPKGSYCVYKKGLKCPLGFEEGYIIFRENVSDAYRTRSHTAGTMPEGRQDLKAELETYCLKLMIKRWT